MIPKLQEYKRYVGSEVLEQIKKEAKPIKGKNIVHINSVSSGGGVAEILNSLVLLMNDVGIPTEWRWIKGSQSFFSITKKFHNALQGEKINLSNYKKEIYNEEIKKNSIFTNLAKNDLVLIHDPQPLALIQHLKKNQKWLWRCHIDLTHPYKPMWDFISSHAQKYDWRS